MTDMESSKRSCDNDSIRILLTFLGDRQYHRIQYYLKDSPHKVVTSSLAGSAIAHLAGPFDRIIVLMTKQSSKNIPLLADDLDDMRELLYPQEINADFDESTLLSTIDAIISSVTPEKRIYLTLDITHGYRYLPLIYFSAISYLIMFRDVEIEGILYGQYTGQEKNPVIDLKPAYTFVQWSQAAHSFVQSGQVNQLAGLLEKRKIELIFSDKSHKSLNYVVKSLKGMSFPLSHALPLEIGHSVRVFLGSLERLKSEALLPPVFTYALDEIIEKISPLSGVEMPRVKSATELTQEELDRELSIAYWFLAHDRIGDTLILLREFLVNLVLLGEGEMNWLDHRVRSKTTLRLGAISRGLKNETVNLLLDDGQREVAELWDTLSSLRNIYAHAGFKHDRVKPIRERSRIEEFLKRCTELDPTSLRFDSIYSRLLVSPLGLSPGTLYSSIETIKPDYTIVITSSEALRYLDSVLSKTKYDRGRIRSLVLEDAFTGFEEIPNLVESCQKELLTSENVCCNITGGTTLMGEAVRSIYDRARISDVPAELFALVDRRSRKEQEENPFVKGELIHLIDS